MIWIGGGTYRMGSEKHYPEEAPAHRMTDAGRAVRCWFATMDEDGWCTIRTATDC
jgi:hypothetical protein